MTPELVKYARSAVKRGVKALDKGRPGWEKEIDLTRLDLSEPNVCMLGQLYGNYTRGLNALSEAARLATVMSVGDCDSQAMYGFERPIIAEKYDYSNY